ncbi:MAG: hypothetical protein ACR2NR_05730 [Solirubrobacteraceae bacterium]
MLLKHRAPEIDSSPVQLHPGLGHLDQGCVAVLRWLHAVKLDFVIVGPVAHAIRGDVSARGPVGVVPAPYGRNFDRLANALIAQHAGLRSDRGRGGGVGAADRSATVPVKLTADKLARGRRWMLSFGGYDLDVEGAGKRAGGRAGSRETADGSAHAPRYQELLYEAGRFELAPGLSVEVASPEDLEHFSHVRRTGTAPEFRITRTVPIGAEAAAEAESPDDQESRAHHTDSSADA